MKTLLRSVIFATMATAMSACAEQASEPTLDTATISALPIKNFQQVEPNVYSAGQPTEDQIKQLAESGVKVMINLRPESELSFDEQALVVSLGMEYVSIPVAGAEGVSPENANRLASALEAVEGKPTVVHCGSANRVGALVALDEALNHGASVDDAIAKGKDWGLTRLESIVRYQLSE